MNTTTILIGPESDPEPILVPYYTSGVPGLVVTPLSTNAGLVDGVWKLTHKESGRAISGVFNSKSAARAAAKRIAAAVPTIQWTDTADKLYQDVTTEQGVLIIEAVEL